MFDKSVITICVPPKLQLRVGKLSETDKNKIKKEVEVLLGGATDIITCTWIILEACFEEMPLYTKKDYWVNWKESYCKDDTAKETSCWTARPSWCYSFAS